MLLHQSGTPVAGGIFKTNVATGSVWQQATISLTYVSSLTPDTLYIHFSSSSLDKAPKPGSVLWIDDVAVTLVAGIDNGASEADLLVYPNPTKDQFRIELPGAESAATLLIYDINGKLALSQAITDNASVNTGTLGDGVYTLRIISENKVYNRKLILTR